ncbi:MAG: hypothetical protein Q8N99_04735 [Nanoarchaeota archaeon]|nr:hypothetical protein [Nanoarchaeota archaeon]
MGFFSSKQEKVYHRYTISTDRERREKEQTEYYNFNAIVKGNKVIDRYFCRCRDSGDPVDKATRNICCISPEQASQLNDLAKNGGAPSDYLESLVGEHAKDYQQKGGLLIKIIKSKEGRVRWERLGVVRGVE